MKPKASTLWPVAPQEPIVRRLTAGGEWIRTSSSAKTQYQYIRDVKKFADFLGRSADKATAEDVHRYQLWLASIGTTVPTTNVSATALRFFFKVTLKRPDLAEYVVSTREPRRLPVVLSPEEVGRLLASATNIKHKALLSLAYATGIRWLFVIARTSSFSYKGEAADVKQVGRELGVRYVLEGSVRKSADRVRIIAQLIDASTGAHLWADHFDGLLQDVFELQDKVASSVLKEMDLLLRRVDLRTGVCTTHRWREMDSNY